MKIETKLNIDDECYFIENNRINEGTIRKIEITIEQYNYYNYGECLIYYSIAKGNGTRRLNESEIFKTVEEALEYLKANVK